MLNQLHPYHHEKKIYLPSLRRINLGLCGAGSLQHAPSHHRGQRHRTGASIASAATQIDTDRQHCAGQGLA
jgi:hypothetical protein